MWLQYALAVMDGCCLASSGWLLSCINLIRLPHSPFTDYIGWRFEYAWQRWHLPLHCFTDSSSIAKWLSSVERQYSSRSLNCCLHALTSPWIGSSNSMQACATKARAQMIFFVIQRLWYTLNGAGKWRELRIALSLAQNFNDADKLRRDTRGQMEVICLTCTKAWSR